MTVFFALETLDSGCSKVVKKYWFSPLSMYAGKDCEEDYWGFLQVVYYYFFWGGEGGIVYNPFSLPSLGIFLFKYFSQISFGKNDFVSNFYTNDSSLKISLSLTGKNTKHFVSIMICFTQLQSFSQFCGYTIYSNLSLFLLMK